MLCSIYCYSLVGNIILMKLESTIWVPIAA